VALAAEVRFFKTRRPEPPRFWQPKQLRYVVTFNNESLESRTSEAKALISLAVYGTAEAVPFVQSFSASCKAVPILQRENYNHVYIDYDILRQ
jgi:hypothetical protein